MPLPISPAKPADGATVNIANVGTTSANVQVCTSASADGQVRIVYRGAGNLYIKFGKDSNVTATTTADIALLAPCNEVLTYPAQPTGQLYIAAVADAAGQGAIYFTPVLGN